MANDISPKLNKLKSIARFGKHPFMSMGPGAIVEIFGSGKSAVSFLAVKDVTEFDSLTKYLYNSDKRITANFVLRTFQEKLSDLLRILYKEDRSAIKRDWDLFITNLLAIPENPVKILAPIYGVMLAQPSISFGDFTIYQPSLANAFLKQEFPKASKLIDQHFNFKDEYMIGVTVKAKDLKKCQELATKAFYSFENVSNFITASFHKTKRIGIFNYSDSKKIISFLTTETSITKSRETVDNFQTVQMDDPVYNSTENKNNKIWQLITSPKNDLEEKLLDSIEWCGRALVEVDDSKALLQYIICIESLLQFEEDKFISASIVSQLRDMTAFLLGENYKQRISYSTYVKDLYKIRSSITHSGKGKITELLLHTAHVLCYKIIRKILTTEPYNSFKTKEALCKYLSTLKYGFPDPDHLQTIVKA